MGKKTQYFFCYNRDELASVLINGKQLPSFITEKRTNNSVFKNRTYFDDLDYEKTDPEIFESVKRFLANPNAILLYISDLPIVFRWAEKEIVEAVKLGRTVIMLRPAILVVGLKRNWSLEKIARKGKKIRFS